MYEGESLPLHEIPQCILEGILAAEYKWTLDYIRTLSPKDFQQQLHVINTKKRLEAERMEAVQNRANAKSSGNGVPPGVQAKRIPFTKEELGELA